MDILTLALISNYLMAFFLHINTHPVSVREILEENQLWPRLVKELLLQDSSYVWIRGIYGERDWHVALSVNQLWILEQMRGDFFALMKAESMSGVQGMVFQVPWEHLWEEQGLGLQHGETFCRNWSYWETTGDWWCLLAVERRRWWLSALPREKNLRWRDSG